MNTMTTSVDIQRGWAEILPAYFGLLALAMSLADVGTALGLGHPRLLRLLGILAATAITLLLPASRFSLNRPFVIPEHRRRLLIIFAIPCELAVLILIAKAGSLHNPAGQVAGSLLVPVILGLLILLLLAWLLRWRVMGWQAVLLAAWIWFNETGRTRSALAVALAMVLLGTGVSFRKSRTACSDRG